MPDIAKLFSLLDDPDDRTAQSAMAELLKHENELDEFLRDQHESADPLIRKRVHQLEAIVTVRRRRRAFTDLLAQSQLDLFEGLIQVHLLWYDNDSQPALYDLFAQFCDGARKYGVNDLYRLGNFMRKSGFSVAPDHEALNADNFCIGPTLEDRMGSELLLALLALEAAGEDGLDLGLVRLLDHFALVDAQGNILMPRNSWQVGKLAHSDAVELWNDPRKILRYLALMLFLAAVGTDSFRYIHTIAGSILGTSEEGNWDFLPYPYHPS